MTEGNDGLIKRLGVRSTLATLVDGNASGPQRAAAGVRAAGGVAVLTTAGVVAAEGLSTHATPAFAALWSNDSAGLVAFGAASVVFGIHGIQGRVDSIRGAEGSSRYTTDAQKAEAVAFPRRNRYRTVGAVSGTAALGAGLVAVGLDHLSALGASNVPVGGHVATVAAEVAASVAVAAGISAGAWGHRGKRQTAPAVPALSE